MNAQVYICHCISDKEMVSILRKGLEDQGILVYCDSRVIRSGDPLEPETRKAIESARAFILVISSNAQDSKWVREETQFALQIAGERGKPHFITPILINGAELGALKWLFPENSRHLEIDDTPGSLAGVMPDIIQAIKSQ